MKKIKFFSAFLLLFMLFLLTQCNKDDDTWGDFTVNKDGNRWTGDPRSYDSKLGGTWFDISNDGFNEQGFKREEFSFASVPKEEGRYQLAEFDPLIFGTGRKPCTVTYNTYTGDGQAEGIYTIAKGDSVSFLEITEVSGRKIKGNFSAVLLLTEDSRMFFPYLKDTVVFTDGTFHTKLNK